MNPYSQLCQNLKYLFFSGILSIAVSMAPSIVSAEIVRFPVKPLYGSDDIVGRGDLNFPKNASGKLPLVILAHGTRGVGYREERWSDFLNEQGYATLILDYFTPRGSDGRGRNVPRPPEDVWGAINFLVKNPKIDSDAIAVMGFSNGGSVTRSAAELNPKEHTNGILPKAFVMVYGGCHTAVHTYNSSYNPALLYIVGSEDELVTADVCETRVDDAFSKIVEVMVIKGAYHMFDGDSNRTIHHPRWGTVRLEADSNATEKARAKVASFLEKHVLGPEFLERKRQRMEKQRHANLNGTWTGKRACQGVGTKNFEAVVKDGRFSVNLGGAIKEQFSGVISSDGKVTVSGTYVDGGTVEKIAYAGNLPSGLGQRSAKLKGAEGSGGCDITLTSKR